MIAKNLLTGTAHTTAPNQFATALAAFGEIGDNFATVGKTFQPAGATTTIGQSAEPSWPQDNHGRPPGFGRLSAKTDQYGHPPIRRNSARTPTHRPMGKKSATAT